MAYIYQAHLRIQLLFKGRILKGFINADLDMYGTSMLEDVYGSTRLYSHDLEILELDNIKLEELEWGEGDDAVCVNDYDDTEENQLLLRRWNSILNKQPLSTWTDNDMIVDNNPELWEEIL